MPGFHLSTRLGQTLGRFVRPRDSATVPTQGTALSNPVTLKLSNGATYRLPNKAAVGGYLLKALALGTDLPNRFQGQKPMCGLYDLGKDMDYFHDLNPANPDAYVVSEDQFDGSAPDCRPTTNQRIFEVAKKLGFTTQGEMFSAANLGRLAQAFGYNAKVTPGATIDDVKACLGRGHPALMAFDVDPQGDPGMFNGTRAHWAAIESWYEVNGVTYFIGTHSWDDKERPWLASEFIASSRQLNQSDFPGAPKDISKLLADQLVEIWPKAPSPP